MEEVQRVTPGSIAAKMAARRRELISRPLAEIWEELAKVAFEAMPGSEPGVKAHGLMKPNGELVPCASAEDGLAFELIGALHDLAPDEARSIMERHGWRSVSVFIVPAPEAQP